MTYQGVVAVAAMVGLALVIVVLNDWWKQRMPRIQVGVHRLRELNQRQGFIQKLWTTFLLLVFAALITPLLVMGLELLANLVVKGIFRVILETIGAFYLVLLVYIWWRPGWLMYLYEVLEFKLVATACMAVGLAIVASVIVLLVVFAASLL